MTDCRVIRPGFHHYRIELVEQRSTRIAAQRWYATVWRGGGRTAFGSWIGGDDCTIDTWRPDRDLCGATPAEAVSKARKMAREWVRWQLA